jgi:hypothetical protein
MASSQDPRRRFYYWLILALPIATLVALAVTGRWQSYWTFFREPPAAQGDAFAAASLTALIWSLSTLPLLFTAWSLGRHHTAARRLHFEALVGIREVVRLAIGCEQTAERLEEFARPPRDRPGIALLIGLLAALAIPVVFMVFLPTMRTSQASIWLVGAGILAGGTIYCQRRASAYLIDEPPYFNLFRQHRLLNPMRYEEAGRKFVRAQIVLGILLMLWWMIGASIVMM